MHDPAETLQAGASGVDAGSACSEVKAEAASTGKRMVSALGDASSPDRTRCRRGARGGGLDVARPNSVHSFPDDQLGSGAWWFGQQNLSSAARVGSTHAGACGWLWPPP
jgi:hypothetical protein